MRPAKFEYFCPTSIAEAATLLAKSEGSGRILAGGQSLLPAMNLRLSKPSSLIDIRKVPELSGIAVREGKVYLGALARHADIVSNDELYRSIPLFRQAGRHIAHATIREHGTIGGSLALADPASEWCTVLSLLGAKVRAVSVQGERLIGIEDFFVSYYTTALTENEILVGVEVPIPLRATKYGFAEFSRQSGAFALAMVAVSMEVGVSGSVDRLAAWVGGCAAKPIRVPLPERFSGPPAPETLNEAFDGMRNEPSSDIHASGEDRKQIAKALLRRCMSETYLSSKGGH